MRAVGREAGRGVNAFAEAEVEVGVFRRGIPFPCRSVRRISPSSAPTAAG